MGSNSVIKMGRRRKEGTDWLPPRVYRGRSAFELKPVSGGVYRLCPLEASKQTVWRKYHEQIDKLDSQAGTFKSLVSLYFESPTFREKALSTQKKYRQNATKVLKVFGHIKIDSIKPEHIRKYMDVRGESHPVAANREKSFMQAVYNWAYERGKAQSNPCKGVKKYTEKPREKYITDKEYQLMYQHADSIVKAVMEISYCCAARVSDVLTLRHEDLDEQGISIKQGKTGALQIKAWSDRLRAAVDIASNAHDFRFLGKSGRIITNERGSNITYDAFRWRWNKTKESVRKAHPDMKLDFTFHDIKAKSISDWEGDKQKFSGHKSAQMVQTYDRKVPVVGTHE